MRVKNWESNLYSYIETEKDKPFIWGESDCCHFVNGAIKSITGIEFKIPKLNIKEAAKYIKENKGIESIADNFMNKKDVLYSSRGDIVSANTGDNRIALGLCMGDYLLFKSESGLVRLPVNSIRKTWGID